MKYKSYKRLFRWSTFESVPSLSMSCTAFLLVSCDSPEIFISKAQPVLVAIWDFVFHGRLHCVDNIFSQVSNCHPNFSSHTKSSSTEVLAVDNRTQAEFSWADVFLWRGGGRELSEDILLLLRKLFLNLIKALFQKNALLSRCWVVEVEEDDEKRDFVSGDPLVSSSSQTSLARVRHWDPELARDTESSGLKHSHVR